MANKKSKDEAQKDRLELAISLLKEHPMPCYPDKSVESLLKQLKKQLKKLKKKEKEKE